ncbi:MAG: hypothetical protein LC114_12970, partial [Bryobacterales bacterium]|nr:hypothetical protein [Bryobacterales bacterium]
MSPTAPIELSELRADHSQPPLPAQKVATAVESIANSESRRLAWLLHAISHQEGGLVQLAFEMLKRVVPDKLGTPSLRAAGVSLQSIYSGEVYEAICGEIDHHDHRSIDAIKMEMAWNDRD